MTNHFKFKKAFSLSIFACLVTASSFTGGTKTEAVTEPAVAINEVAWMGTSQNYNAEWMELKNNSNQDINLSGWKLTAADGTPSIPLTGTIRSNSYFLLERTDDHSVPGISADVIYTGALSNTAEDLQLIDPSGVAIDHVDAWHAGDNNTKATMERKDSTIDGTLASNWVTATSAYDGGFGTPKAANAIGTQSTTATEQHLNHVSNLDGAINVYFNKSALTQFAYSGNDANYNINFEDQLINRINAATTSIDVATYEINLPRLVDALIEKASQGVKIRVLADAKDDDPAYADRYATHRMNLEKLYRGKDNVIGTADDAKILSDSPMFAVEDASSRSSLGLPVSVDDIPVKTVKIGSGDQTGHMFVDSERKTDGTYYSPNDQMHNKFMNIDGHWVWTGTWNFTETGLYGSDENMAQGILDGNQNETVEINSSDLSNIYTTEFEEMWGSNTFAPDPANAKFHGRKVDNTPHQVTINGTLVEVYFSPGDQALQRFRDAVKNEAQYRAYFEIFAFSDQLLGDELKNKWEGSYNDLQGVRTGFEVKGLFDPSFWNQWWSASIDMTQRTASTTSVDNPNTRWNTPAPVYKANESRKMHAKTMLIDPNTSSDPMTIVGSTNWSSNGDSVNDENMLIIHNDKITNQFLQEFYARYQNAGGAVPATESVLP